jgi:hypothetical protein
MPQGRCRGRRRDPPNSDTADGLGSRSVCHAAGGNESANGGSRTWGRVGIHGRSALMTASFVEG